MGVGVGIGLRARPTDLKVLVEAERGHVADGVVRGVELPEEGQGGDALQALEAAVGWAFVCFVLNGWLTVWMGC